VLPWPKETRGHRVRAFSSPAVIGSILNPVGDIVQPDMTIVDERTIPAGVAPAVIDAIRAHGLYPWIYRAAEWYVTDPGAVTAAELAAPDAAAV